MSLCCLINYLMASWWYHRKQQCCCSLLEYSTLHIHNGQCYIYSSCKYNTS